MLAQEDRLDIQVGQVVVVEIVAVVVQVVAVVVVSENLVHRHGRLVVVQVVE